MVGDCWDPTYLCAHVDPKARNCSLYILCIYVCMYECTCILFIDILHTYVYPDIHSKVIGFLSILGISLLSQELEWNWILITVNEFACDIAKWKFLYVW